MSERSTEATAGFRLDINGLRAWAVAAVVLYHFGVPGFSGGFVGVDVFFVISGFLMAGIVIGGLERQRFSLPGFYLARARRIVPALVVVVLLVLITGWIILTPFDYQALGRHARESLQFTSNLRYLSEAGYFDSASHEKWLLHTWSLSVEWQFYLAYPLALMLLARWLPGRRTLLGMHVLALLLSLGWSCWLVSREPSQAFFLLPSRAWELLLGGLVFLLLPRVQLAPSSQRNLELAGYLLILLSLFGIDASMLWPGALALLPTLGAALVLLAARQNSAWSATQVAQWLGTRSYSIYLWHWPLMVWLTYYGHSGQPIWVAGTILLSLLLGHLSYHLIEVPARVWLQQGNVWRRTGWLLLGVIVIAVAAQQVRRTGIPSRIPEAVARVDAERTNRNPRHEECLKASARCVLGGKNVEAVLIGDSHADAVAMAVVDALQDPASQGIYFKAAKGCLLVDGANQSLAHRVQECESLRKELNSELDTLYPGKPLIIINRVTYYAMGSQLSLSEDESQGPRVYFSRRTDHPDPAFLAEFQQHYLDTICRMALNRKVYVLQPLPDMPVNVPQALSRAMMRGETLDISTSIEEYQQRNAFARELMQEAAERCGVELLDPAPLLCAGGRCAGVRDGLPLYVDDDHLSMRGNRLLIPLFQPIFGAQGASEIRE